MAFLTIWSNLLKILIKQNIEINKISLKNIWWFRCHECIIYDLLIKMVSRISNSKSTIFFSPNFYLICTVEVFNSGQNRLKSVRINNCLVVPYKKTKKCPERNRDNVM